jgi:elongation factor G
MKEYNTASIRNVALVSHSSAGKTMLAEAILHFSGATTRLGKIEDGTTASDFDEEEIRRGISLYTSMIPIEYKDKKINLLDTPGYTDFVGEVVSALRVADSAIVLVDSVGGLEVGTEIAWNYITRFKLPRFVVINKMERENANFQKALDSVQEYSEIRLVPVQLPLGEKADFKGVIDLLSMKALKGDGKTVIEIPPEYREAAEKAHVVLMETAAEGEDSLIEKYFENGELTAIETLNGLRSMVRSGTVAPVFVAAGVPEIGIGPLLDAILALLPSPGEIGPAIAHGKDGDEELPCTDAGPLAAYVWKRPPTLLWANKPFSAFIQVP